MRKKTAGFTLIELMIAMVVASIGILAIGWILIFTQSSWKEGNAKLELQRDASLAILKIEHELKPAILSDVVCNSSELIVDNSNGKRFFLENDDLKYQVSSSDSPELVVEGDSGTEFDPPPVTTGGVVVINFTLVRLVKGKTFETTIATSVKPRN